MLPFVNDKVRAYAPPMLYDGLPQAIKNIRTYKELTQVEAAKRGGTTADTWSQWESRTKRLLRKHLPIVTKGLKITESELHRERERVEDQHYDRLANVIGEPKPIYDRSVTAGVIGSLPHGQSDLPPAVEDWQNRLTTAAAGVVSIAVGLAECVKDGPPVLREALSSRTAEDNEDNEDGDDPGEEPTDR